MMGCSQWIKKIFEVREDWREIIKGKNACFDGKQNELYELIKGLYDLVGGAGKFFRLTNQSSNNECGGEIWFSHG